MKKRAKKADKFSPTEVGTLIEAMRREFKPILEDIPGIKAKLDGIFEQVGKNTEILNLVGMQIKSLQEKVGENTKEIRLNRDLINRILEEMKTKVDRKDFELLEKKVSSLGNLP